MAIPFGFDAKCILIPMPPDRIDPRRSVLVLVDYQQRLLPAIHDGERVVAHAVRLADAARILGIAVIGTEQNPAGLGPNAPEIRSRCDETLAKMAFDGCADGLAARVRAAAKEGEAQVAIAGCEAHVCLMQTALGLRREGFPVWIAADACGSRRPEDRELALRRLERAGAVLASGEMLVFEWLGSCEHPRFRDVLALLKAPRA
jgi:nicotinamidase-related amidase